MSFSVEEKKIKLERLTSNPPSGKTTYAYNLFKLLHEADEFITDRLGADFGDYVNNLAFSFLTDGDGVKVYFKLVKSSGPIVGFLGYYIDLSSGYVLLDTEKSNEYIPFINMYSWLKEEKGIDINPEVMMSLVERYKIGDLDSDGFSNELSKVIRGRNKGSAIGTLLRKETGDIKIAEKDGEPLFKMFIEFFYDISYMLHALGNEYEIVVRKEDGISETSYLSTFDGDIAMFIRALKMNIYMSTNVKSNLGMARGNYDNLDDTKMRALSTMLNTGDTYDRRFFNASTYRDMTNTDSLILNLRDIVEEREDDTIVDFDDLALRNSKPSKDEIYEVIEKIGVDEYLSGRDLGTVTKGLGSRPEVADYINKATAAIKMSDGSIPAELNIKIANIVSSFRKNVRFYRGSLEIIDSNIR